MNSKKNPQKITYILLMAIIIAGILRFSYGFFVQKESFHSDEAWSFGLANSYYEPYIQYNDDTTSFKNVDTWISSDTFRNYLTVQNGERFSFGSVFYNMSCDTHPPLYFILLNFLCSFFPNKYILSLGFFINIVAFTIMSIFIFKFLFLVTKSRKISLIGVLFCTFSLAMLCMTMFIRMYLCVATLGLIFTYLNAKLFYTKECRTQISHYIFLAITALLGALTDNFFLPYAFIITVVMCMCWIINKDYKTFIKYSLCMLLGIGCSILIFPKTALSAINMLGIGNKTASNSVSQAVLTRKQERVMPLMYQFKLAFVYINREVFGFDIITPFKTMFIPYLFCAIIIFAIIISAVLFIFRKDIWFISFKAKFKNKLTYGIRYFFRNFNFIIFGIILSVIGICFFVASFTDIYQLGSYGDRYLMICYPAFLILSYIILYKIIYVIFKKMPNLIIILLSIVVAFTTFFSNKQDCHYFMKDSGTIELESISDNSDFIIVSSREWLLVQYAAKLINCNEAFLCNYTNLENDIEKISNHTMNPNTYLIVDTTFFEDFDSSYGIDPSSQTASEKNSYAVNDAYINELRGQNQTHSDASLFSTINSCRKISFINNLSYIGDDYINGFHLKVYKVN